jgi:hypothetical protein
MMIPKHVKNLNDLYKIHEYIVKQVKSETVCNQGLFEIVFRNDFDHVGEQFIMLGLYFNGIKLVLIRTDLSQMSVTGYDPQLSLADPKYLPLKEIINCIVDKASKVSNKWKKRDDQEVESAD